MIIKLRERLSTSICHDIQKIVKEFNISPVSLRKYKNMSEEEVKKYQIEEFIKIDFHYF